MIREAPSAKSGLLPVHTELQGVQLFNEHKLHKNGRHQARIGVKKLIANV